MSGGFAIPGPFSSGVEFHLVGPVSLMFSSSHQVENGLRSSVNVRNTGVDEPRRTWRRPLCGRLLSPGRSRRAPGPRPWFVCDDAPIGIKLNMAV